MKMYIQNGFNKRVLVAPNYRMGVQQFFRGILSKTDKGEIGEYAPITIVSNYGFLKDIMAMSSAGGASNQDFIDDHIRVMETASILASMGRKDIAKSLRAFTRKLPKTMKFLVSALR